MRNLVVVLFSFALLVCVSIAVAIEPTPAEMQRAQEWASAKFQGKPPLASTQPVLLVIENHGGVQPNARGGKPMRLGEQAFTRGLYCHAPSKIVVKNLSEGAKSLHAIVGVDTNDQTSGGRGSVEFSVDIAGAEKFRSGVVREGTAPQTVDVELNGARELTLKVDPTPDGISCDQADWLDAYIKLANGKQLWIGDMPQEGAIPLPPNADPPFSFNYAGKPWALSRAAWKCERASKKLDVARTEHTVTWTDPDTGLQVRCVAVEYVGFPTVEWTLHFKNTGQRDTPVLSEIEAADLQLTRRPDGEFVLNHNAGDDCSPRSYEPRKLILEPKSEHRFAPAGGRPTSVGFPYFNIESPGEGLIVVIGWPGQWAAKFNRDEANALRVRGGQELTHFILHPGEEVRSPLIALQFWQGDRTRAQNIWRRWMLVHNTPRDEQGKTPRPFFTSCSGGYFPGIRTSEQSERQFITAFSNAGVKLDYWWLDAGWYACSNWPEVGTWKTDPARYPKGFKPVSALAHENGAGLIVWFEPERVTPGTELYAHSDWLLGKDGEQKLLNLGNPAARQWLTDHVDAMLTREEIDFYRQDFNIDPLSYWRSNDTSDRQGITEIKHIEGYLAYFDELRKRHPGMWIDTCASGGRRVDLETLRLAIPLLRSDYQSFNGDPSFAPGNQGHTHGLSSWLPYHGQGVYFSKKDFVYSARSYMCPAFAVCADVRRDDIDWDQIRTLNQQFRAVADCYLGDFYPLTAHQLSEELWLAWQFDRPSDGSGLVQVFRRGNSPYESARFRLQGLEKGARYTVTDLDQPKDVRSLDGQELMEKGLLITTQQQPAAMMLTYRRSP